MAAFFDILKLSLTSLCCFILFYFLVYIEGTESNIQEFFYNVVWNLVMGLCNVILHQLKLKDCTHTISIDQCNSD